MGTNVAVETCLEVIYVSSAVQLFTTEQLVELVRSAKEFNSAHGITGMLLHRDGSFMQVLEGPEPKVRSVVAKIKRDPRHSGMLVLIERKVDTRQFPDWSMGFRDLHTLSASEQELLGPYLSSAFIRDAFGDAPTAAAKLLQHFKRAMR